MTVLQSEQMDRSTKHMFTRLTVCGFVYGGGGGEWKFRADDLEGDCYKIGCIDELVK